MRKRKINIIDGFAFIPGGIAATIAIGLLVGYIVLAIALTYNIH